MKPEQTFRDNSSGIAMTTGRRSLLFVGVLIAALIIAVAVVWFAVLKPQNEQINDTLNSTVSQIDKTAALRAENERREQEVAQLRRMAAELRGGRKDETAFVNKLTNDGNHHVIAVERSV